MNIFKLLNIVVALILIILLAIAGMYLQKLLRQDNSQTITLQADSTCDLGRQACSARRAGKTLTLRLKQPRYLQKFELEVQSSGFADTAIHKMLVDFSMQGMHMGINRFSLVGSNTGQLWRGIAILPVCSSGRNDWLVSLYVETADKQYAAVYKLTLEN